MATTISEKLEQFHDNNEHGEILKKINDGNLTYRNCVHEWVDNVHAPILHEALQNEANFFNKDKSSKGFGDSKKIRTFDSGKMMTRHPKVYHPLLHPSIPNLITAFYIDECPLIYCNKNYGDENQNDLAKNGLEFSPYDTVMTEDWVKVVKRNKLKFVLSPDDIKWRGGNADYGQWSNLQTTIMSFETEKNLFIAGEED